MRKMHIKIFRVGSSEICTVHVSIEVLFNRNTVYGMPEMHSLNFYKTEAVS